MKKITKEQIDAILNTVYLTNISAQMFDGLKALFNKLPNIEEVGKIEKLEEKVISEWSDGLLSEEEKYQKIN